MASADKVSHMVYPQNSKTVVCKGSSLKETHVRYAQVKSM